MVYVSPNPVSAPQYVRQAFFDGDRMAGSVPVWTSQPTEINKKEALGVSAGDSPSNAIKPPSLSFGEFLDIVNPLHHIPVVGNVYRRITGDNLSPVAQIIGGGLYGGAIGGMTSIISAAMQEHSGQMANDFALAASENRDNPFRLNV